MLLTFREPFDVQYDEEFVAEMSNFVKTLTNKVDVRTPSNNNVIVPPLFTNNGDVEEKSSGSEKSCSK